MTDFEEILLRINSKDIKPIEIKSLFLFFLEINKFSKVNTTLLKENIFDIDELKLLDFQFRSPKHSVILEWLEKKKEEFKKEMTISNIFKYFYRYNKATFYDKESESICPSEKLIERKIFQNDLFLIDSAMIDYEKIFSCKLELSELIVFLTYVLSKIISIENEFLKIKPRIDFINDIVQKMSYPRRSVKGYSGDVYVKDFHPLGNGQYNVVIENFRQSYEYHDKTDVYEIELNILEDKLKDLLNVKYNERMITLSELFKT